MKNAYFPQAYLCACVYVYLRMMLELISSPYLFSRVSVSCWTQSLLITCQTSELASGILSSPKHWNYSRQATIPTWYLFWESNLLSSCLSSSFFLAQAVVCFIYFVTQAGTSTLSTSNDNRLKVSGMEVKLKLFWLILVVYIVWVKISLCSTWNLHCRQNCP